MKNLFFVLFVTTTIIAVSSCKDDDNGHMHTNEDRFEYHVHHVKVTLTNKDDGTVVYSKPDDAHVHATDGTHKFTDTFDLTEANGLSAHTDWILEAKVWAQEEGKEEVLETVEFHLHMN